MNAKFAAKRAVLSLAPVAAAALMAGWATSADAGILATGDNPISGTTSAAQPQLAGTVVQDVDTAVNWAVAGGTMNATVQSRVVLADDGTYDFYWRIYDTSFQIDPNNPPTTAGPSGAILAFRLANFGMPIAGLNGDYRTDGTGDVGPVDATVFSGGVYDQYVNFVFDGAGMPAGDGSYFMFLDTNAHHYAKTAIFDLASNAYGHNSGEFATFGVAGAPEPAAWSLMITGFGLAGVAMRRRRKLAAA